MADVSGPRKPKRQDLAAKWRLTSYSIESASPASRQWYAKTAKVARAGVEQAAPVENEMAEVREAAKDVAHVGNTDAGGREDQESDVWKCRWAATGVHYGDELAPRNAQTERLCPREERRGLRGG